jgi:hypothetical protein
MKKYPAALIRFAFEFFENVFFSPVWWVGLSDQVKRRLQQRTTSAANIMEARKPDCLVDDGLRPVSWTVVSRLTNLTI